jgi:hypothetical protein
MIARRAAPAAALLECRIGRLQSLVLETGAFVRSACALAL